MLNLLLVWAWHALQRRHCRRIGHNWQPRGDALFCPRCETTIGSVPTADAEEE